jgi:hypothetical protein
VQEDQLQSVEQHRSFWQRLFGGWTVLNQIQESI